MLTADEFAAEFEAFVDNDGGINAFSPSSPTSVSASNAREAAPSSSSSSSAALGLNVRGNVFRSYVERARQQLGAIAAPEAAERRLHVGYKAIRNIRFRSYAACPILADAEIVLCFNKLPNDAQYAALYPPRPRRHTSAGKKRPREEDICITSYESSGVEMEEMNEDASTSSNGEERREGGESSDKNFSNSPSPSALLLPDRLKKWSNAVMATTSSTVPPLSPRRGQQILMMWHWRRTQWDRFEAGAVVRHFNDFNDGGSSSSSRGRENRRSDAASPCESIIHSIDRTAHIAHIISRKDYGAFLLEKEERRARRGIRKDEREAIRAIRLDEEDPCSEIYREKQASMTEEDESAALGLAFTLSAIQTAAEDEKWSDSDEDTRKHLGNRKSKLIKKVDIAWAFMLQMSLVADGGGSKTSTFDVLTLPNASESQQQQQTVSSSPFTTGTDINRVVKVAFQWPNRQYKPQITTPYHHIDVATDMFAGYKSSGKSEGKGAVCNRGFKTIHTNIEFREKSESDEEDEEC